jgi:hypothetical protein
VQDLLLFAKSLFIAAKMCGMPQSSRGERDSGQKG